MWEHPDWRVRRAHNFAWAWVCLSFLCGVLGLFPGMGLPGVLVCLPGLRLRELLFGDDFERRIDSSILVLGIYATVLVAAFQLAGAIGCLIFTYLRGDQARTPSVLSAAAVWTVVMFAIATVWMITPGIRPEPL